MGAMVLAAMADLQVRQNSEILETQLFPLYDFPVVV